MILGIALPNPKGKEVSQTPPNETAQKSVNHHCEDCITLPTWVFRYLGGVNLAIYLALAENQGNRLTVSRIAQRACVTAPTVRRAVQKMVDHKILTLHGEQLGKPTYTLADVDPGTLDLAGGAK